MVSLIIESRLKMFCNSSSNFQFKVSLISSSSPSFCRISIFACLVLLCILPLDSYDALYVPTIDLYHNEVLLHFYMFSMFRFLYFVNYCLDFFYLFFQYLLTMLLSFLYFYKVPWFAFIVPYYNNWLQTACFLAYE